MRRSTFALLLCALVCAFSGGLALASAVPTRGAGGGSTTNTSSDSLPDEGPAPAGAAPGVAQPPRGAAVVGGRLTVPAALAGSVRYQWQACSGTRCAAIRGATKPALRLTASLAGKTVRVVATTDAGVRIASTPSAPVRAKR